jgi:competence ComEA-like helix-hairpin-helix protein
MNEDRYTMDEEDLDDEIIKGDPFRIIRDIQHILADDPDERLASDNSFAFPLSELLVLMPERYRKNVDPEEIFNESAYLSLEHLFEQLAHGKVDMPISRLAFFIPLHLIYRAALHDESRIELPLKQVVNAVGLDALTQRTPKRLRMYDIAAFKDPFTETDAVFSQMSAGLIIDADVPPIDELPVALEDEPVTPLPPVLLEDEPTDAPRHDRGVTTASDSLQASAICDTAQTEISAPEACPAPPPPATSGQAGTGIPYPLKELRHPPSGETIFHTEEPHKDLTISLDIPDLMNQLRRGVVSVSMTSLRASIPQSITTDRSDIGADAFVTLDLKRVVDAVGMDALKAATPAAIKFYDIAWMADPFEEPAEKTDLNTLREIRQQHKSRDDAAHGESQADIQTPRIMTYEPESDAQSELDYYELPGNININVATSSELLLLDGMDATLANAIVTYRTVHGCFKSVFDLFRIKGIDGTVFRQMTGMKAEQKHRHRRRRLASLLNIPAAQVAGLTAIADAIARKPAFTGCLITDMDGLPLASTGMAERGMDLSAILPVTLNQMSHNMHLAGMKLSGMLSFTVDGVLYSVHKTGNVILAVAHTKNMIDESDFLFIRKVGRELNWLLSIRAYAGPSA